MLNAPKILKNDFLLDRTIKVALRLLQHLNSLIQVLRTERIAILPFAIFLIALGHADGLELVAVLCGVLPDGGSNQPCGKLLLWLSCHVCTSWNPSVGNFLVMEMQGSDTSEPILSRSLLARPAGHRKSRPNSG